MDPDPFGSRYFFLHPDPDVLAHSRSGILPAELVPDQDPISVIDCYQCCWSGSGPGPFFRIRLRFGIFVPDPAINKFLVYEKKTEHLVEIHGQLPIARSFKLLIWLVYLTKQDADPVWSETRGWIWIRSKTRLDPQRCLLGCPVGTVKSKNSAP